MEFEFGDFGARLEDVEIKKVGKFERVWSGTDGGSIVRTTLVGNMLYYGSFDSHVYALNLDTNQIGWKTKSDALQDSSPIYSDGKLYLGDRKGNFLCLDAGTGKTLWRYKMGGSVAGYAGINNDTVFMSCRDSYFYALNAENGKLLWRFKTGNSICCAPGFYKNTVIFGSFDGYVYCLDSKGKELWRVKTGGEVFDPVHLTIRDNVIYVPSFDSFLYALNAETGDIIRKIKLGNYGIAMSPTIYKNRLYIGARDGVFYCLDLEGNEIWRFKTYGVIESRAVINEERIYFGSEDGHIYCLDTNGKIIWQSPKADGEIWDKPKIYKGKVIFGCADCRVHSVDIETGQELWNMPTSTLKKTIWSDPYGMFKVEIKKNESISDSFDSEKKYSDSTETINLSDYGKSEYTTKTEYKQKSEYKVDLVMFNGDLLWNFQTVLTFPSKILK